MQSDSEIRDFSALGLLGSAVGRFQALRGLLMRGDRDEPRLVVEQLQSHVHEANAAAGAFAATPTPVNDFARPAAGHRGGAFFAEAPPRSKRVTTARPEEYPHLHVATSRIYTDDAVRREVFDAEDGPEKMRALAQAEKDLWTFRDREHAMEACIAAGRLAPDGLDDKAIREKCAELKEMLPAAAEAFQATVREFHEDVDERYKLPTTRSKVGDLVDDCSMKAGDGMLDAFSAAIGAGARYRDACAELKEALRKVDIAVEQNREGAYVPRANVGASSNHAPGATADAPTY